MSDQILQNALRLHQTGDLAGAERLYGQILQTNPRQFQVLYLLGFIRFQRAQYEDAERFFAKAIALDPNVPDVYYNRGCALQNLKRDEEAIACFDKALALKPDYTETHFNRGASLLALRRYEQALESFETVLARTPGDAQAWHNRGDALDRMARSADAVESYDRALRLAPNTLPTLNKRAAALSATRQYGRAAADYENILKADPNFNYAKGQLVYCKLMACDWRSLGEDRGVIAAGIDAGKNIASPLHNILISDSAEDHLRCARNWAETQHPETPAPLWRGEKYDHKKIRVAYLSRDFRAHAVAVLTAGLFEGHDREDFEVTGLSFGPDSDDDMRLRLKNAFDRFIDVDRMNDADVARLLRQNETDIVVDLMGYTGGCRPGIFAYRPAPVQAGYLGFPGTTGSDFLDYIIADRIVIPEEERRHYSEKVVYLPDSFQVNDSKRREVERLSARGDAGLPETGFVFCSFNNSCKILPEIFDVWMQLLHGVEGSVLWLRDYRTGMAENLRREALARGIKPERVLFAPIVASPEHYLAWLGQADLFLDTLPYNAHATASDALWMGVPVLTRPGTTYAGRVAASLLHAVGLPELIAGSLEDYQSLALRLAREPAALAALKVKLHHNRKTCPLFDTKRFCRYLEAAYRIMWERSQRGAGPAGFAVESA